MSAFLLYLLEASAVLAIFYLLYVAVMRKETFFELNRFFLLAIVAFSLLFPLMSFDVNQGKIAAVDSSVEEFQRLRNSYYQAVADWEYQLQQSGSQTDVSGTVDPISSAPSGWLRVLVKAIIAIYLIGIIVCLTRMFWSVRWLIRMIRVHPVEIIDGISVVLMPNQLAPFSFLNYAFVYQGEVGTIGMAQIIAHEKTHIRQKHSLDLIIVQLIAAFQWFNPLIWRLIQSLKTTHEYIADKKIINSGYSLVEYQTLLLSQLISNNSHGLVHNFNLSFIKKRITMMKNHKSGWSGKLRVAFSLAIAAVMSLVIVQCNTLAEEDAFAGVATEASDQETTIKLPTVPGIAKTSNYSTDNTLLLRITNDQLSALGKDICVDDLLSVIEKIGLDFKGAILLEVDQDQKMEKVREVQSELRRLDRRKILYAFTTASGERAYEPLLLPPLPGAEKDGAPLLPTFDLSDAKMEGNVAKKDGMEFLKVDLGNQKGTSNVKDVYEFVQSHVDRLSLSYVVSAKYSDEDQYGTYLANLIYVKEGFNQIYEERAQEKFSKSYGDLDKSEYRDVRKGVPTAISIAEK